MVPPATRSRQACLWPDFLPPSRVVPGKEAGLVARGSCQPLVWWPRGERSLEPALPETGGLRLPGDLASLGGLVRPAAVPSTLDVCACDCRCPQLGLLVASTGLWFRIWW